MTNELKTSYLHPYQAKVEFLALKETVDKKRRAGYSVRAIYNELKSGGHLSMSYSSFSNYIRMAKNDEKGEIKPPRTKKASNGKLH